jgi:hypothetical protein
MKFPSVDFGILATALLAVLAVLVSTPLQSVEAHASIQLSLTALFSHR